MTDLPLLVRRSPQFFYGAAVVVFAWSLANTYADFSINNAQLSDLEGYSALIKSRALFEAAREALWYLSSGIMFEILIAIHNKVKGK
jgi:hypothetical protein